MEKKVVTDKNVLFALTEPVCHFIKVAEDIDEYLKVWVKEPTWLEVDKAMNSLMKIDAKSQNFDLDLNAMYRFMVENFVVKTEPSLYMLEINLRKSFLIPLMLLARMRQKTKVEEGSKRWASRPIHCFPHHCLFSRKGFRDKPTASV